ncbi:MAG: hypothetical protein K6E24_02740 [bacterium]|nr:hypothetical protein [bacterium]
MSKGLKIYFAIMAIIAIMFTVLAFVIPFEKKSYATFIVSYVGVLVALAVQCYVGVLVFKKSTSLRSKVYGIPVIRVSIIYLILQMITSVVLMITNAFVLVPVFIPAIILVLLTGFAAIGVLITVGAKSIIESIEKEEKQKTAFMNNFKIEVESLENKTSDSDFNKDIHKFVEKVKYSDPMSANELVDIENEISIKYDTLKDNILNEKLDDAKKDLAEINDLVDKRNRMCKLNK